MGRILLRNADVFDGTASQPRRDAWVLVVDDHIEAVGEREPPTMLGDVVVECGGRMLLPGLIDTHVHLSSTAAPVGGTLADASAFDASLAALQNAEELVRHGVTTARDLGSVHRVAYGVASAVEDGRATGADIVPAVAITPSGGHGLDISRVADGEDSIRRAIREEVFAGAGALKVFLTGGTLGKGSHAPVPLYSARELRTAIEEAHRYGMQATAHVFGDEGVLLGLECGLDNIEHAVGLTVRGAERLAASQVPLSPTLAIGEAILSHPDEMAPAAVRRNREFMPKHRESVGLAYRAGVVLTTGTDAGMRIHPVGRVADEVGNLVASGVPVAEALMAATARAAHALGLPDRGQIAPGKRADLLLVEGDPLLDWRVLHAVALVIKRGSIVVNHLSDPPPA